MKEVGTQTTGKYDNPKIITSGTQVDMDQCIIIQMTNITPKMYGV